MRLQVNHMSFLSASLKLWASPRSWMETTVRVRLPFLR